MLFFVEYYGAKQIRYRLCARVWLSWLILCFVSTVCLLVIFVLGWQRATESQSKVDYRLKSTAAIMFV
jgi:hypothetical protein